MSWGGQVQADSLGPLSVGVKGGMLFKASDVRNLYIGYSGEVRYDLAEEGAQALKAQSIDVRGQLEVPTPAKLVRGAALAVHHVA